MTVTVVVKQSDLLVLIHCKNFTLVAIFTLTPKKYVRYIVRWCRQLIATNYGLYETVLSVVKAFTQIPIVSHICSAVV